MTKLSVLISVYGRESPEFLHECLASLQEQTLAPEEIVVVKDGPIGNGLESEIALFQTVIPIVTVPLPVHSGLGIALAAGVNACKGRFVARMDADDICLPHRFEVQLAFLEAHPDIDVVGGTIAEFDEDPAHPHSVRRLPCGGSGLSRCARLRNPLNHMTVMFRRSSVLEAGGYQHCPGFEDYWLWARMMMRGFKMGNLEEPLVLVRAGNLLQSRRGGIFYLVRELRLQRAFYRMGFINFLEFMRNVCLRVPVRLIPSGMRGIIYRRILRSACNELPGSTGVDHRGCYGSGGSGC
jgi:glycosyltransferase involved in cell wall biosynthesis